MSATGNPDGDAYLGLNRSNWDERVPLHLGAAEYAVEEFAANPDKLSDVVEFDRERLGDISGLRAAHLQCHIGTDTISLARLGAEVTGLDFSPVSIAAARELAERSGSGAAFVEAELYSAADALGTERFDLVYTGIGALCWLPDIARWARTVAALLVPGGRLFLREAHPVLWAIDEERTEGLILGHPYFETSDPGVWDEPSTYVGDGGRLQASITHQWNHGIGEIITALFAAGLRLTAFMEHTSVPWEALPGRMSRDGAGEWSLTEHPERVPLSYTLQAVRPA
ncbi:MAG TPA: class I SAM-dependent methyltransferase [Solirubrobacterales bacterium]|nr:class I SAM-dependent methyltransferase [Solirubrobacterales bacterium]